MSGGSCSGSDSLQMISVGNSYRLMGSSTPCQGSGLKSARFTVEGPNGSNEVFEIADVQNAGPGSAFESYQILSMGSDGASGGSAADDVCIPKVAEQIRTSLGLANRPIDFGSAVGPPDPDGDKAIIVPGPLYTANNQSIPGTADMFQMACLNDALAKRSTYGEYRPGSGADQTEFNTAALKMLTATYCGKPYTMRGVVIKMVERATSAGPEAAWSGSGALCLDTPRLWTTGISTTNFPAALQPAGCLGADGHGICGSDQWLTAVRAECGPPLPAICPPPPGDSDTYVKGSDFLHSCIPPHKAGAPVVGVLGVISSTDGFCDAPHGDARANDAAAARSP